MVIPLNDGLLSIIGEAPTDKNCLIFDLSLQEGLLCFDENGKFLRTYEISLDINASDSYKVNCIQNIDGDIWIGAGSNLLSRLDERTEAIDNYSGSAFNFGAVHCLLKYTDKELLVGTDNEKYLAHHGIPSH